MQLNAIAITSGFLFAFTILTSTVFAFPASTDSAAQVQIALLEELSHWHCSMCVYLYGVYLYGNHKCTNLTAGETKSLSWQGVNCTTSCNDKLGYIKDCDIEKFKAPPGASCACRACDSQKSCL